MLFPQNVHGIVWIVTREIRAKVPLRYRCRHHYIIFGIYYRLFVSVREMGEVCAAGPGLFAKNGKRWSRRDGKRRAAVPEWKVVGPRLRLEDAIQAE